MSNIENTTGDLGDLEAIYGPALGQHILDEIQRAERENPDVQFIDVKESSEKLERIRQEALALAASYLDAKREYHNLYNRYMAGLQTKAA